MAKAKVRVPQKDGEITVRYGAREPHTYRVTDHLVTVDEADVLEFVGAVPDSKPADDTAREAVDTTPAGAVTGTG